MAEKYYTGASGNWSTTANWNNSTLPTSVDNVYANGKTITINVSPLTINSLNTTTTPTTGVGGGNFNITSGITLIATSGLFAGTASTINSNATLASGTLNITAGTIQSGSGGIGAYGFYHGGTATVNISGTTLIVGTGTTADGIVNYINGTINAFFDESYRLTGTSTSTGIMINNAGVTGLIGYLNFKGT